MPGTQILSETITIQTKLGYIANKSYNLYYAAFYTEQQWPVLIN